MLRVNQYIRIVLLFGLCLGLMASIMAEGAGARAGISSQQFTRITEGLLVNDIRTSAGICIVDYDGDGLLDIYMINSIYTGEPTANSLFRNSGGGVFEQVVGLSIVTDLSCGYAASWADFDNDGDLDVAIANLIGYLSYLYINNGNGDFAATTNGPYGGGPVGSTSASWVDYDLDNDLDLFITNAYGDGSTGEDPYPNFLYRNDNGTLNLITSGDIATKASRTYGAAWGDYDSDGDPDLVTINTLLYPSDFYLNNGDGSFTLWPTPISADACQGDAVWVDYDNDGDLDFFVAGTQTSTSLLYRNEGGGSLVKVLGHGISNEVGKGATAVWADFDNDGDQDVFATFRHFENGIPLGFYAYIYENLGDGAFERLPDALPDCDLWTVISAMCGDLDRDGDVDLFLARYDPAGLDRPEYASDILYLNNGNSNHWITIKPIGTISNRSAAGAKVHIKATINGQPVWQLRELTTIAGRHVQPPLELHFGLGNAVVIDSLKLEWPSGIVDIITDVEVDQYLEIMETRCGDANGDDGVNVGDAVYIINYVFKGGPSPDPVVAGDANCDGDCNVGDAVYLINFVFKGGPGPCADCP